MEIILTHGYILTGTGSNLYVSNLARELCMAGHNVHLVAQESDPMQFDFVSEYFKFDDNNKKLVKVAKRDKPASQPGKCVVYQPDIAGLLPVYVYDHYEGFAVKEMPDCSDDELERYIHLNATALTTIANTHQIDVVNTNHTVLFPHIAAVSEGCKNIQKVVTVHGSALNFTVKTDDRFVVYARSGFDAANDIIVDSAHAEAELNEFLEEHNYHYLLPKIQLIPAGVDVDTFGILFDEQNNSVNKLVEQLAIKDCNEGRSDDTSHKILYELDLSDSTKTIKDIDDIRASYDYRKTDPSTCDRLATIDFESNPTILFIGKYLWTKGIHLIIEAIPDILQKHPNAQFVFVGFGPFREVAEILLHSISTGDVTAVQNIIDNSSLIDGNKDATIPLLQEILNKHGERLNEVINEIDIDIRERVIFTGILSHAELQHLLPACDVLIAPSVFPEAFGMVAIEAMACGVSPVLTYQSAFKEIWDEFTECAKLYTEDLVQVNLDENASLSIAQNVCSLLDLQTKLKSSGNLKEYKEVLRNHVVENYSWKGIAKKYIEVFA